MLPLTPARNIFETTAISYYGYMADSIGFEPMRRVSNDSLANCSLNHSGNYLYMAPQTGIEPMTERVTAVCSTAELLRNGDVWASLV